MNVLLLLKQMVAHVVSDFFLQTNKICEGKCAKGGTQFAYLTIHSGINALLAYTLVGLWDCWQIPVAVFFTHYLIDYAKSAMGKSSVWLFITDQLAHLTVILVMWCWLTDIHLWVVSDWLCDNRIWTVALCYMLALKPASILLGLFIANWTPANNDKNSLPNAGAWIGYFERVLILTFMLVGCMEGIGFLLAAKSIFRFGELTKPREVKITEYVMIGTLSSFTIAILLGTIALKIIR